MRLRTVIVAAALLAACDHGWPFQPGAYGPTGPFSSSPPVRLTFNPLADRVPRWLPDGAALLYSAERLDRADRDHCLALLPAGGGAIRWYVCRTSAADDSVNVFDEAAAASDGQLAYVRAASRLVPRSIGPDAQALVLATLDAPADARVLRTIPYPAPSGRVHEAAAYIAWLGPTRLVYLGQRVTYPRACSSCAPDTVRTGIEIATLDFAATTPVVAIVAGTDSASSVAVGAGGDTIYFTRNGDSRVYRHAFSSGLTVVAHDFGAGRFVRDIHAAAGRLTAVIDGRPIGGGELHLVTLATGADTVLAPPAGQPTWFARPALSPDGGRVVAEARALTLITIRDENGEVIGVDTIPSRVSDLWLVPLP